MQQQAINKASSKQIAFIKRLKAELGENQPEISYEIGRFEASKLIKGLIAKAGNNSVANGLVRKINEPRLGMAMKECFRVWKKSGWNIYKTHRELFIKDAINTYNLFTEIAERIEQNARGIQK
jgi:hypothetical protein